MHYSGLSNQVIDSPTEPLQLENCTNVLVKNPQITGGYDNIELYRCKGCVIEGGTLHQPIERENNPLDPVNHNIIFNLCVDCIVRATLMTGVRPRGDAINFYNSKNCVAEKCMIRGLIALHGTVAIIDGPKGSYNSFIGLVIESKGNVNVCGGIGHVLKDLAVKNPVAVTGEYYKGAKVRNLRLIRVTAPELYVHRASVTKMQSTACKFARVNYG